MFAVNTFHKSRLYNHIKTRISIGHDTITKLIFHPSPAR